MESLNLSHSNNLLTYNWNHLLEKVPNFIVYTILSQHQDQLKRVSGTCSLFKFEYSLFDKI